MTAAAELVTCCGPAAVSLREVARIVGVSHNAPYRHFPTRQALLAAVAAFGFETLFKEMKASSHAPDPAEHLREIGRVYIAFALRQRGGYQMMFNDEIQKSEYPELSNIAEGGFMSLKEHVTALNPDLPDLQARGAATTVWGLMHGIAHLILDNQLKDTGEDDSAHNNLIDLATRILVAGLIHAKIDPTSTAAMPSACSIAAK